MHKVNEKGELILNGNNSIRLPNKTLSIHEKISDTFVFVLKESVDCHLWPHPVCLNRNRPVGTVSLG